MLFKFTYPTRPDMGDFYADTTLADFTGRLVDSLVEFPLWVDSSDPYVQLDPQGLEIYALDPNTGKTIDRVKWTVRADV